MIIFLILEIIEKYLFSASINELKLWFKNIINDENIKSKIYYYAVCINDFYLIQFLSCFGNIIFDNDIFMDELLEIARNTGFEGALELLNKEIKNRSKLKLI